MPRSRRTVLQQLSSTALGAGLPGLSAAKDGATQSASPQVRFGRLERWPAFRSRHVDTRPVEVWLPPTYDGRTPHAVLYMHDGQMLFDAATTWNRQAWAVDQVAAPLLAQGVLRPFIVVGPWNNGALRFAEYFPQAWLALLDDAWRQALAERALQGAPRSDAYLRFLVEELKPAVDARYATRPAREHTALMGSSMGGLISLYGLCEHPQVFGAAGCLSTHWIGSFERNRAVPDAALRYLRSRLPPPDSVRLWMDRGTRELDALYDEAQSQVDALMAERGFAPPRFRSLVHEGSGHNESDWQRHLAGPLTHLMAA
ncbi:alpha/beta hydrolase-fold protein [Ideonella sp. DXS22W]|uniref:Acyl-CoA:diacylglycerol acyltransferase n=1 Tax=Pseudaquabacterium inlustre TaxID=2984192 RepID=A0ABU9CHH9_9BURK